MANPPPYPTQISVHNAINLVQSHTPGGSEEQVSLTDTLGRTLSQDLRSLADHPSTENSAMDGYACRETDTTGASESAPVTLEVVGEVPAGQSFPRTVGPGQAVRIYTGGTVPAGSDAILPIEFTREQKGQLEALQPATPKHIRPRAQDLVRGNTYLTAGTRMDSATIGLAAAMGHSFTKVVRQPRIGILATGNEIIAPGNPLKLGQVYNANAFSIAAMVRIAGGIPVLLSTVTDNKRELKMAVAEASHFDLLLTSGGVSMGRYDFVRDLLLEDGKVHFWKVAMQPGGPVMFGSWQDLPILGLPGNPVSSMVVFLLLGRAFIDTFLRLSDRLPYYRLKTARAGQEFRASIAKETFHRIGLTTTPNGTIAHTTGNQSSGVLRSMVEADALAVLKRGSVVSEGDNLSILPLGPYLS
jgi:molybdopterin molybdotransferase